MRFRAIIIITIFITACEQKESHEISLSMDSSFKAIQDLEFNVKPKLLQGEGVSFSLFNNPPWLTVNSTTGELKGIPSNFGTCSQIRLVAKNDSTYSGITFDIDVIGDPLSNEQWYLENIGQTSFSATSGLSGEDVMAKPAFRLGFTGSGILIGISDTGLEIEHEDLKENVDLQNSKNYSFYDLNNSHIGKDPTNLYSTSGDHGTSVAGIAGATGWNNIGIRGVAPKSKISGINFLGYDSNGNSYQLNPAIWLDQLLPHNYDIINQSWTEGWDDGNGNINFSFKKVINNDYIDTIYFGVSEGRNKKGVLYVRAGGNDGYWLAQLSATDITARVSLDSNYHQLNTNPYTINVGALSAFGIKANYSSPGANLWVSAPGGEDGIDKPAILTTDQSGCDKGVSKKLPKFSNTFETGNDENPNCNYTSRFNGTSAATPIVSGTVALMLEANPNLNWRDVKYILAATSDRIDSEFVNRTFTISLGTQSYDIEEKGWVKNAAGFYFHNWYGFGRINIEKAVKLAKNYNNNLGELEQTLDHNPNNCELRFCADDIWKYDSNSINISIPDKGEISTKLKIDDTLIIEAVQIRITIEHERSGHIGLKLISPSGTVNTFLQPSIINQSENIDDYTFLTNAFFGENSVGDWELKIFDAIPDYSGTLKNWKINIIGHTP